MSRNADPSLRCATFRMTALGASWKSRPPGVVGDAGLARKTNADSLHSALDEREKIVHAPPTIYDDALPGISSAQSFLHTRFILTRKTCNGHTSLIPFHFPQVQIQPVF